MTSSSAADAAGGSTSDDGDGRRRPRRSSGGDDRRRRRRRRSSSARDSFDSAGIGRGHRDDADDDGSGSDGGIDDVDLAGELVRELLSLAPGDDLDRDDDEDEDDDDDEEDDESRVRRCEACRDLLDLVRRARKGAREDGEGDDEDDDDDERDEDAAGPRLRDVLGPLPPRSPSDLAAALTRWMGRRTTIRRLLPATQDEGANREAMGLASASQVEDAEGRRGSSSSSAKAAGTLTPLALAAAELCAELIGLRGAWGAGIVDVGGVGALAALVRRWSLECRGREGALIGEPKGRGGMPPAEKRSRPDRDAGHDSGRDAGKAGGGPARRSVRISEAVSFLDGGDGESDEDHLAGSPDAAPNNNDITFQVEEPADDDPEELSERDLLLGGLRLARSLSRASNSPERAHWSPEAREAHADGACAALGTAAALAAGLCGGGGGRGAAAASREAAILCRRVAEATERGLLRTTSATAPRTSSEDARRRSSRPPPLRGSSGGGDASQRLREDGTYLLRGLLPLLRLKVELPNGQAGKLAAYEAASSLLVNLVSSIAEEESSELVVDASRPGARAGGGADDEEVTPRRGGRRSLASLSFTPARRPTGGAGAGRTTSASGRRRGGTKTPEPMAPPSLKKSVTPRRTRNSSNPGSGGGGASPSATTSRHPVLDLVVGLLQKVVTGKGLERADARSRAREAGMRCLERLPVPERRRLLAFVEKMCVSKVSSHRMLGAEVVGEVLRKGWFWRDCRGMSAREEGGDGGPGDGDDREGGGPSSPSSLLAALRGRLSDRSPAVRARAALSLAEVAREARAAGKEGRNLDGTVLAPAASSSSSAPAQALAAALCDAGPALVEALRRRASRDGGASVRKASIAAWVEVLGLARDEGREDFAAGGRDVSALCQLCHDASVATRKAAADALTELVRAECSGGADPSRAASSLEVAWAHTVLPLAADVEATCAARAVQCFASLVIDPIAELGEDEDVARTLFEDDEEDRARYLVSWRLLARLSDGSIEAGGSRNASGSLVVALRRLLVDSSKDSRSLAKNLFRAVHCVGSLSLGLDLQHSQDELFMSDGREKDLFDSDTTAMRTGAWCLLDALTSCLNNGEETKSASSPYLSLTRAVRASKIDASFLASSLQRLRELLNSTSVPSGKRLGLVATSRDCMRITAKMGSLVPIYDAKNMSFSLLGDLEKLEIGIDLIPERVSALIALTRRICDDSGRDLFEEVKSWADGLLGRSENAIESCISSFAKRGLVEEAAKKLLVHVLYLIGEVSMIGFSSQEDFSRLDTKQRDNDVAPTIAEPARGLLIRPSPRLVHLVKLMLPESMPLPASAERQTMPTPSDVRAHAYLTLGKLCLRDEALAKESMNVLARELHADSGPAVQGNCLMVMGDMCVRYTNLTDRYLPFMAACLQAGEGGPAQVNESSRLSASFERRTNRHSLVKKNAILLLSSLLLQDYIKWRGLLVHRFLAAVADEDDEVSCLAQAALRGPLLDKRPDLLCNHFVGSVFVFNDCKAHPLYAVESASGGGNGLAVDFDCTLLYGGEGRRRRKEIYEMMLGTMADEQKLEVTARLVKEVLGGALETNGDLSAVCKLPPGGVKGEERLSDDRIEAATNVLTDTLAIILTSPKIKVGRCRGEEDADEDDDPLSGATNKPRPSDQRMIHKRKLLTKISRKHLVEIVIPIVCNLKTILEGSRSPLLRDLMMYLGFIFRSYRGEVREHLANDPTLLQELEFDMRKYQREKKQDE